MKVFISHSSIDKPIARKVAEQIRLRGWTVWIDEGALQPGDKLTDRLVSTLSEIDILVIIVTANALASYWVKFELDQFIQEFKQQKKRIVPLLFENVELPQVLKGFIYGDCRIDGQLKQSLNKVFASADMKYPMPPDILAKRLKSKKAPAYCIRIVPKNVFSAEGNLGKSERCYVSVGDYFENCGYSSRQVLANLYQGALLEDFLSSSDPLIAFIFEVGDIYYKQYDLLPGTWKAVFRILSDQKRLAMIDPTSAEINEMRYNPGDYYEGDQQKWETRVRTFFGDSPHDMIQLRNMFGIVSACFDGTGTGPNGHRIFFMKNIPVARLNCTIMDLGTLDDGNMLL